MAFVNHYLNPKTNEREKNFFLLLISNVIFLSSISRPHSLFIIYIKINKNK